MNMDWDFQGIPELLESESEDPEFVVLNRQYLSSHPWVHSQKFSKEMLDFWVTCETPSTPDSFREPSVSSDSTDKKCFIDKIDLKSLVEDPESFNIDSLFETNSVNETRKKWDRTEELKILHLINNKEKSSMETWIKLAAELGRTVNSVRIKAASLKKAQNSIISNKRPTLVSMITDVVSEFGERGGSVDEVIEKIEERYGDVRQKKWKNSVKQILATNFLRVPGVFKLLEGARKIDYKKCSTMGEYIVWVLGKFGTMTRKEMKEKIWQEFSSVLPLGEKNGSKVWEQTFSKKLKTCKVVDCSRSKTTYKQR